MVGGRVRGHFRKSFLPSGQPQFSLWLLGATVVSVLEEQGIPILSRAVAFWPLGVF